MTLDQYFDRPDSCYFVPDPGKLAAYCRENWEEDVNHILRIADEVCENTFLFDLSWDMERTYEPVTFPEDIDWSFTPSGDPEFVWQFNRHRYFICLGQAWRLTGDEKYVKGFLRLINDWMDRVPLNEKNGTGPWRMLETGLRGETWTKAIRYFKDSSLITEDFLERFAACLRLHAQRLVEKGGDARLQSNWCVLENSGLFEIAMGLPQTEETGRWAALALKRIRESVKVQVYEDGSQWEQSPMYHNEVYHCLCCVIYLAKANGIRLDPAMEDAVHRMALANVIWKKPDGCQFTQGDSDDTDLRDKITMGAWLFKDPVLKYSGFPRLDYESAWDFGYGAVAGYDALACLPPDFTSAALKDSGNYYLRESWEKDANLLHFTCGAMSTGHCHGDKLHVDLVINGEDVLVDGGRSTYMNVPIRFTLKDNPGHNTTTVDGKSFTTFADSWETEKLSLPVNRSFRFGKTADFVQGGHLGYISEGIFVNRRVIWIKPDIYLINDQFYAAGEHEYRQFFHFAPEGRLQTDGSMAAFRGKKNAAYFRFLTEGTVLEQGTGITSRHYNQWEENSCLTARLKKEGFASMITVINGGDALTEPARAELLEVRSHTRQVKLADDEAQAVKITVGDRSYVVILCHNEVFHGSDAVIADNCFGAGNVCVFDVTGVKEGERVYGGEVLHV